MKFSQYVAEGKPSSDASTKLVKFFKENPYPDDEAFHDFAEKNDISPQELEAEAYEIVSTFLSAGFANKKGITEDDVDPDELKSGIAVEYEHLDKKSPYAELMSKRIALDHLAELKDYYTRLKKMEGEE